MKKLVYKSSRSFGFSVAILGSYLLSVSESQAASLIVNPGWDLWETVTPGTVFQGIEFEGVPLETFDFDVNYLGVTIGVKGTGTADTIVQRLDQASVVVVGQTAPPIAIELVALQLKSVNQIDLGPGLGYYYATLNPDNPSLGTMDITFDTMAGGEFDSIIDVHFDLRFGDLDGPIVLLDESFNLESSNTPWGRTPPPDALLIDGVNHRLNGIDTSTDFWAPFIDHDGPHIVETALAVPEVTSSFVLAGLLGFSMFMRKRS